LPQLKIPTFPVPKINYCDLVKKIIVAPGIVDVIRAMEKSGNPPAMCPLKPGSYYMKNLTIDDTQFSKFSMIRTTANFLMQVNFQDENGKSPIVVSKHKIYFSILR
jgi:hypothetical protein